MTKSSSKPQQKSAEERLSLKALIAIVIPVLTVCFTGAQVYLEKERLQHEQTLATKKLEHDIELAHLRWPLQTAPGVRQELGEQA